jgi:hypothetical protein
VDPVGPSDKENQVKMYIKKTVFEYPFETVRIWIHNKQSDLDLYQIEK